MATSMKEIRNEGVSFYAEGPKLIGIVLKDDVEKVAIPETYLSDKNRNTHITCIGSGRAPVSIIDDRLSKNKFQLVLPKSIKKIEKRAFEKHKVESSIVIPEGVSSIGSGAFEECEIGEINWPSSCDDISESCFSGSNIDNLTILGAANVQSDAFYNCKIENVDFSGSKMLVFNPHILYRASIKKVKLPFFVKQYSNDLKLNGEFKLDGDGNIVQSNTPTTSSVFVTVPGQSFAITGTLSVKRDDFKKIITSKGGHFDSSVKASTNYLIIGDKPGDTKLNAAKRYHIETISEQDFWNAVR